MKFCKVCDNILVSSTVTNELLFICNSCGEKEKSTDADTLMYSESIVTGDTSLKYEKFIQNAHEDVTNPTGQACEKCGKKTKYVRLGAGLKRIDICDHKVM